MAKAIAGEGRIALYGIYFDFNKAELKPESDPTLEQMAKLLRDTPQLKLLVVGHTDNVGTFPFNTELSQRRAAAVVSALTTRFGISKDRLTPVGVSLEILHAAHPRVRPRRASVRILARERVITRRLTPFASPVSTNKTEEGRARNRRVELVEN